MTTIHVQPRASRTEVVGTYGAGIKVRVAAPPLDGEANQELIRFLAKRLGVPRSAVRIVAGLTTRTKRVAIDGMSAQDVQRHLTASA